MCTTLYTLFFNISGNGNKTGNNGLLTLKYALVLMS